MTKDFMESYIPQMYLLNVMNTKIQIIEFHFQWNGAEWVCIMQCINTIIKVKVTYNKCFESYSLFVLKTRRMKVISYS